MLIVQMLKIKPLDNDYGIFLIVKLPSGNTKEVLLETCNELAEASGRGKSLISEFEHSLFLEVETRGLQ